MIICGSYDREDKAGQGNFTCPICTKDVKYQLLRTYRVSHIYFVPIGKQLQTERLICDACGTSMPITVLAARAPAVSSSLEAGDPGFDGVASNLGNVIALTPAAAAELLRRHGVAGFSQNDVVRVMPGRSRDEPYLLVFDYVLSDGRDWIGESCGIPILVARRDAPLLCGITIDYRNGKFCDEDGNR